jgi:HPt (histidine-containing phosphotransfer) domain-containing protein
MGVCAFDPKGERKHMADSLIDFAELLTRVENDRELLRDLLAIFKEEFPRRLRTLRKAVESKDANRMEAEAHALKGMLFNLAAREAGEAAARLEQLAKDGKSRAFRESLAALEDIAEKLLRQLDGSMAGVSG